MTAHRSNGFTLIEVMIALAILTLSLSVLYGAFENALIRTRHDGHLAEAVLLAQSLLSEGSVELKPDADGRDGEWNGFSYQLRLQSLEESARQAAIATQRVTATVRWSERDTPREIQLSTLRLTRAPRS